MFKLNNKGWGLGIMILFICVFFLAILIISALSAKYGLMSKTNPNANNSEPKQATINNQKYFQYEQAIGQISTEYVDKNYSSITKDDVIYININKLNIQEEIKKECTGYVKVGINNNINYYNPYIKCDNYQTEGYDERYAK